MLSLVPYDEKHLPSLALLQPAGQDLDSLKRDLTDAARGFGAQVAVAVENDQACGVAGWVSFGVETEGIVYGSPLLAGTRSAADLLLRHVVSQARDLDARELRVSRFPSESAKEDALAGLGFLPILDMISMERPILGLPAVPMPEHLLRVPYEAIDWEQFARTFNTVFAEVPNAPPLDASIKRQEWEVMDREASHLWQDAPGRYTAWIGVHGDGYVDEIGVDESLRGQGVASALYKLSADSLMARGVMRLYTLLASTNHATLRLHEKLGFKEFTRRTVFALNLRADPSLPTAS